VRWLIVTPYMHKVHHSDWRPETDSKLLHSPVRVGPSLRVLPDALGSGTLVFGLNEFTGPGWQAVGMMKTPFVGASRPSAGPHTEVRTDPERLGEQDRPEPSVMAGQPER